MKLCLSLTAVVSLLAIAIMPMHLKAQEAPALAPGYGELGYELPAMGSYSLPPLGFAADGEVLDVQGKSRRLYDLYDDSYVLLAFIYSSCSDVNGCPLTSHVFYQIKSAMRDDPEVAQGLKLVSLSFDPKVDTPEVVGL